MVNPDTCAPDTLRLWSYLPQFLQDTDAANDYTFLTWLDGIGVQQQILDTLCRDTPDAPGWSIVLDVSRCPTYALPWLGQFVGVRFEPPVLGNDAAMRAAIASHGNFGRGTVGAIVAAITPYLGPGGSVNVIERCPDPYSITIKIYGDLGSLTYAELAERYPWYTSAGGTPDVTDAFPLYEDFPTQNQAVVDAAIEQVVPGGLVPIILYE